MRPRGGDVGGDHLAVMLVQQPDHATDPDRRVGIENFFDLQREILDPPRMMISFLRPTNQ
jgi:hypothetical protein